MATNLHPKIEQFEIQSVAASWDGCCCCCYSALRRLTSHAGLKSESSQDDSRHRQIIVIECTAALAMSTSVTPAANCNWKAEETWASTLRQHMNGPQTLRMTVGGRRTRGRRNGPNMEMSCSQKRKLTRRGKKATQQGAAEATSDGNGDGDEAGATTTTSTTDGLNRGKSRNVAGLQHIR